MRNLRDTEDRPQGSPASRRAEGKPCAQPYDRYDYEKGAWTMGRVTMEGRWRVRVVGNDADFPQRIVITGSTSLIVPGVVGKSFEVSGKRWTLGIEHQPFGRGAWCPNAFTNSEQMTPRWSGRSRRQGR